mmetsp:Transcript_19826/g.22052  ORF Transcript_19826/g.22052 Transcript_19826/m.22052 type:complete len:305 (-) Transcript_19826:325-1239(-)
MHFISSKTEPMVIYDGVSTGLGGGVFLKKGFEEFLSVMITLRNVTLTSLDFAFRGAYGSLSIYDSHIGFESQGYVRSGIKASLEIANCTVEAPLQVEVAKLGLYESTISSVINNTLIYKNPNKQVDNKANDGSMTSTTATLAPFSWDETRTKKKQSLGQQVFFLFIVRGCTIYVSKSAFMTIYQRDASLFLERNKFILKEPLSKTEPHSLIYVHWTRDDLSYQHILSMYKNQTIPENVTSTYKEQRKNLFEDYMFLTFQVFVLLLVVSNIWALYLTVENVIMDIMRYPMTTLVIFVLQEPTLGN